jgi:hypothetical protein
MDFLSHREGGMVFYQVFLISSLKVVTNDKGEAVGEVVTIIC